MFQKFVANNLEIDNVNRSVTVNFTLNIDEDTVNEQSIYVTKKLENKLIHCEYKVVEDSITLIFDDNFAVNTDYVLNVTSRLKSIVGDPLALETIRDFRIESNIDSECEIISPANHEDLKDLVFAWEEIPGKSGKLADNYYLEVAPDLHFFRPILKTEVKGRKEFRGAQIEQARQYWVRVRSQISPTNYGNWSEPVTFTYTVKNQDNEEDEFVYIKDLELISKACDGTTPKSFILEFDKELDPDSVDFEDIILLRRGL